jgi:hypothetical protein
MNSIFTKWAHQSVTVEHASSTWDNYGNPGLATSSEHIAIVQKTLKLVRGRDGIQKVATCEIFMASTYAIGYDDKITLPTGEQPKILAIESPVDFDGVVEYYRVYT